MKKFYVTLLTFAFVGCAFAQNIPNSSFETWSGGDATGWTNSDYVTQSTDAHTGTYAARAEYTGSGSPTLSVGSGNGTPTTTRWGYLNFYYKFNKTGNANITVSLYMDNPNFTIGQAATTISTGSSTYKAISIPISYNLSGNPTLCTIDMFLNGSSQGSYFIVDDVTFSATPLALNDAGQYIPFSVFPNPAQSWIKINLEKTADVNTTLQLLDVTGRELKLETLTGEVTLLDVSDLPQGLYYVAIKHNGAIETKKIVIER